MTKTVIPQHAKCVFKGIIFGVYHWEQKMFDGRTETFEAITRNPAAFVLPMSGEKIYYVHQEQPAKPPYYSLPGGRIDEGEEPLEAAKRELEEETGLTSDNWELFESFNPGRALGKTDYPVYFFIARDCKKTREQKLDVGGEKIEILETTLDDFLTRVVFLPNFQQVHLRNYLAQPPKADKAMVEDFSRKLLNR